MVFSSPIFLFLFLPSVLAIHFVLPRGARNAWLLLVSLVFYAWGEPKFVPALLASILANFAFGFLVDRLRGRRAGRCILAVAVAGNLGLLAAYNYPRFLPATPTPLPRLL